jgi:protein-disulfide isomerase
MPTVDEDEDLTRKQRREQARTQRKELEEAEAASATRRRRLTQLAVAVAVVVVAIVIVAIVASGGSSKSGPAKSSGGEAKVTHEVGTEFAGIPQSGNTLGSPNAPVTLQYFGDLECPICKEFTLGALPTLIQKYVREGKLRIEYRSLETATREPETFRTQQIAALAAGAQGKMWNFLDTFYREQGAEDSGYVTEAYLKKLAAQVPGLDKERWMTDRSEGAFGKSIEADAQAASAQGFNGTPSFLIGPTGGTLKKLEYNSLTDPSSFEEAIESVKKG